ncbi:MAG TPA: carboxylesterase/lipase family protein, partial [Clostridiales bacterium]|nr:carboxylesterase/lipase family protein [Clostridiales bacterium]
GNNLPVLVWIHGGGFMTGTASDLLYQGDQFARGGVIFVSIEYRLNVLGVFDFSTFSGCEDFESNCALSDMIEALKWINHNISAFGGDAGNITIAGESAGGTAVVTLMAVPQVRGLFRRVIAQSALCNCVMTPQMARRNSELFIEGMGWSENDLQKLCTDDSASFLQGVDYVGRKHQYRNPGIFLPGPVIDDLLPLRPLEAIRAGHASGISLIIGTNLNEGTMFVRPEDTNFPDNWEMVQETFTKNGNTKGFAAIKRYYSDERHLARHGSPLVHFATDYAFEMPSIKVAEA